MKLLAIISLVLLLTACGESQVVVEPKFDVAELQPGGAMTTKRLYTRSFVYPGKALSRKQQLDFWTGFSFFRDPWVTAPSATEDRDGLGPLFNTRSCVRCHTAGSRAKADKTGEILPFPLVIRLGSVESKITTVDPVYGGQIQPRAIRFNHVKLTESTEGEAWLKLDYRKISGQFSDGERYELWQPSYQLSKLAYGELSSHIGLSPRFAPNVFGAGLLNAIDEADLLAQEDSQDTDQDGISAVYNRVPDVVTGKVSVGRFGFKAKHPNLYQQVAAAFRDDIGITNNLFLSESCTGSQTACQQASSVGGHDAAEIPDKLLDLTVKFNEFLGVPPARDLQSKQVNKGRKVFYQLGCQQCHTPSYTTAKNYPIAELAEQKIWPYTDLALHDMGADLADGVYEFKANGSEWRTPPLWGIGLQKKVTGEQRYLHDGRARTIQEAILWHGGEAQAAKQAFSELDLTQRQALIKFLRAI